MNVFFALQAIEKAMASEKNVSDSLQEAHECLQTVLRILERVR